MTDRTPPTPDSTGISLDEFLRDVLPDVKLALGALIDRENARSIPGRYARLLPQTLLVVSLRSDAADALEPLAGQIEHELTDSCTRHGSLYDRIYSVQLRRAAGPGAPVFSVAAHAGQAPPAPSKEQAPPAAEAAAGAPHPPQPVVAPPLPSDDPDATRVEGWQAPAWDTGRWMLVVEDEQGNELEAFRLAEPFTTVGRRSEDPRLQVTVALSGAPHVSRRQLAILWDGDDPMPGFRVFNLGLNVVHVEGKDLAGAHLGRRALDLDTIGPEHSARAGAGTTIRIGDHGPSLRIVEVPEDPEDPDATVHE